MHTHTHAYTHMPTHTYTLPACKCIFPSSHSQKKPLLFSLLKAPSSLSLQCHCPAQAGLSLCDPMMSLLPGWGLALQLPTFASDLHRAPSALRMVFSEADTFPIPGGFQLSLLTHIRLILLLPHGTSIPFPTCLNRRLPWSQSTLVGARARSILL